jgi:hypothetical protein
MSFLNPALFAALIPLAALPLVLHLLNKGFPRHFKFPSVELIRQTMAQRSKVHQWRHWILIFLRTVLILLLLLAFLRPVMKRFGGNPADQAGRQVLILIDHSLSMEDKGDGPTSRERAAHEAAKLIDSLSANDSVNLLLMDASPTTCFVSFSKDFAGAKQFVNQLKPEFGRADVNLASTMATRLIGETAKRPEVYYISDFTRKKWGDANFKMLPPAAKLYFVDVGPTRRDNHAILDVHPSQTEMLAGDTVPLEISVGNFATAPFSGRVTVTLDKKFSFDQEISIAPWSEEKITVPVSVGGRGIHQCEVRLPQDSLEYDNRFALTLSVLEKEEVPIVTDSVDQRHGGAYFLKAALNPFANDAGSLLPQVIASSELSPTRLAGVQKVFLTKINRLNGDEADALAKFLFRGGGLVYFLDGSADPENLAALEKIIGPNSLPLRLSNRNVATNILSGAQQVVRGDFKSPYLKLFAGATRQDLALLEFYDYYHAGATSAGGVLLEYGDGSPAMASVHYGLGTLLILNFSAGEFSSNLARQRIFPAWMQDLTKALSSTEPPPSSHLVGETLHTEIWRSEMRSDLLGPAGEPVTTQRELTGERCALTFTPQQLGFYTLGAPRPSYVFAVNPASDQSDLRPMDKSLLPTEFADQHEAHLVAGGDDYAELAQGRPIFQWFLLGALAVILIESAFQLLVRRKPA